MLLDLKRYSPTEYPVSKQIPFNRRPLEFYRLAAGLNAFRLATQGGFNSVTNSHITMSKRLRAYHQHLSQSKFNGLLCR